MTQNLPTLGPLIIDERSISTLQVFNIEIVIRDDDLSMLTAYRAGINFNLTIRVTPHNHLRLIKLEFLSHCRTDGYDQTS